MFYEIIQFAPLFSFGYIDDFLKSINQLFRTNKLIIYDLMIHHHHLTERCCTEYRTEHRLYGRAVLETR